ncbi:MAG: DUF3137 domain-containing protein [Candidatus Omnitrophota bacterium]
MRNLEEFREFYHQSLMPDLVELEEQRQEAVQKLLTTLIPALALTVILAFLLRSWGDVPLYILFLSIPLTIFIFHSYTKNYINDFKERVIRKIVAFIDTHLKYTKQDYIPKMDFQRSKIFLQSPDCYLGDDRVSGFVGTTKIDFSEIRAQYRTRDSKGRTHYHTFFHGLFFAADFNKNFAGRTIVLPDTAEQLFGGLGQLLQSWNMSRPQLIRLEDPEFEKLFAVYGDDQVEARYILSTSLMKRIVDFKKAANRTLYLSFVDSYVYVAIAYGRNLLEPSIFKTLLAFGPIQQYFEDLQVAIGIVEDLNLNTRIWSK